MSSTHTRVTEDTNLNIHILSVTKRVFKQIPFNDGIRLLSSCETITVIVAQV